MRARKPTVVALVGPTCSGKTAVSLSLAELMPLEVVACDSRTVYRCFDIGTAKPTAQQTARVPHHMLDVAEPDEVYTAARYRQEAAQCIDEILSRGRLPLVCGGTGFYARALLEGLVIPEVAPQIALRERLNALADAEGNSALHARLNELDPVSAARLNPNDRFRIIRALEVCEVTGQPFSQVARHAEPPYHTVWIGLTVSDRSLFRQQVRARFDEQMSQGMLAEVKSLLERFGASQALMNTVNYRQLVQYLRGKTSLLEAGEEAVRHNCRLARRQLIWFRANRSIRWFATDELDREQLVGAVAEHIRTAGER